MTVRFPVGLPFLLVLAACADLPGGAPDRTASGGVRFTLVTDSAGLGSFRHVTGAYGDRLFPETMGSGGAFIDYDVDGWMDLLVVGGANWPGHGDPVRAIWLFRNNADGTFTDVTEDVGLGDAHAYGFGLAVADYDLDGDPDFFLSAVFEDLLFRNDADSGGTNRRFQEVGAEAGVRGGPHWGTSATFFMADPDPYPDLFVAQYVPWTPETDKFCSVDGVTKSYCTPLAYDGLLPRFYRNNGDGTFSEQTSAAGFDVGIGRSLGVLPLDYDNDGHTDLMVTNDALRDLLFHSDGDGTFTEVALFTGVAFDERGRARAGMGVDAGVMDPGGTQTIYVGNFSNENLGVYRYTSAGTFQERASMDRLARPSNPTLTFGLVLFDADSDGDLDLYAANGHVQDDIEASGSHFTYRQPPHLFLNDGNGAFTDAVPGMDGPFSEPRVERAAAVADFDRDGDVDLVTTENGGRVLLWRNDTPQPRFVRFEVLAADGVSDALGARVRIDTKSGFQERFVRNSHSYLSVSEAPVTFGLAAADERIDSVRV
ncbi:MAG TPA: CRTAC1 family protein, partial [Rhodothermales bacterium]